MRLSKIRIAGFKSFVDPVTLDLRSNLTAILGPNGCGKSNTIDAVRWVMGESSAKHLRGSSMEDVIFNGSSSRKPVGLATVELVFDNAEGKLGGEYADYAEIAIKRQVSRDGESKYFLNGSKCRRRDITDIFLGTGLGARSYAIIEQGMISRLIEAKPEELRTTLEEAAGISRYKERRRETETRMAATRENLERLTDLREEVEKQLDKLDKQAKAAQRFRELREQERRLEATLLLLQWTGLKTEAEQRLRELSQRSTDYQALLAQIRQLETVIEQLRQAYNSAHEQLNAVQAEFYQAGNDITRLEQAIAHQQDIQRRQQDALHQAQSSMEDALRHSQEDREKLTASERLMAELIPREAEVSRQLKLSEQQLVNAEQALHTWQEQWQHLQQRIAEPTRQAQVEKARIEQLERQLQQTKQRLERLQLEATQLSTERYIEDVLALNAQVEEASHAHTEAEQQLATLSSSLQQLQQQQRADQAQLDIQRARWQTLQGRLASLETLQQAGLDKANKTRQQWLQEQGLAHNPRLAEQLQVEAGWELAVETVLANDLDAICVDELPTLSDFPSSGISLIATQTPPVPVQETASAYLASKIAYPNAVKDWLSSIRCADTLAQALSQRQDLPSGESFITREGLWVGKDWLRSRRNQEAHSGILQRQHDISALREQLTPLETSISTLQQQQEQVRETIRQHEQLHQQAQAETNRLHRAETETRSRLHALQQRLDQLHSRRQQIEQECAELDALRHQQQEDHLIATEERNEALIQLEEMQSSQERLAAQREPLQTAANTQRHSVRELQEELQRLRIELETQRTQCENSTRQLERMASRLAVLEQQHTMLAEQIQAQAMPQADLQAELTVALTTRAEVEQRLGQARQSVQAQETAIRQQEQTRHKLEQQAEQLRTEQEERKLDWQAVQVREQTLAEQFAKTEWDAAALQAELADNSTLETYQLQLDSVQRSIQRLGAINLAAIEEFNEQTARKHYLDQQNNDLIAALDLLTTAIQKIDRETRLRFKETFERVNGRLQDMFPRLFGGGECYLAMTDDDLLTTGVAIMARPPGKRIASIYLLSGGEKALTAVALVFAIFELNPAPFCLLDEVDAPLDEANVGRFCELVRHMSAQVQFIFITHNKTTMELAENLIGVTMREPGVSRLVAVDVAEAVKLASS